MHSHLAKMLGQYIYDARTKKGILQRDLAEQIGMSAQFLGRIEKGEVMIPEPALKKAIGYLSLSENKIVSIYRAAAGISAQDLFKDKNKRKRKRA